MASKLVTVQYRYLKEDDLPDNFHLKDIVVDVLSRAKGGGSALCEDVSARKKDLDQDGSFVVLNKLSAKNTWNGPALCGQLIHVKAGINVPGILGSLDQAVPELELRSLFLEDKARIVEGVLYFAIIRNHVGLIEGQRTRARTLERYLTRLLQDAGEMEPGETIVLNARLEGRVERVKELSITPRRAGPSADDETIESSDAATATGRNATVLDVLKTLGWSAEAIESLESGLPEDGWLEGFFKVVFKRKGRRSAPVDRAMLETALRNLDPASIGMLGVEGDKQKGGLVKLSKRAEVALVGDLLDPENAMDVIVQTLKHWSTSGRIDCDFEA